MNPQPPLLVIRKGRSFWVEQRSVDKWFATLQALREGCFRDAICYDATGGLWPILNAAVKDGPSLAQRLLPWRQVRVALQFGPRSQTDVEDIVSRLAVVLGGESEFNDFLGTAPTEILHRFKGAETPSDVIRIASECMRTSAA